jgi:2-amino-4-hydroxy-6-hydroxymethyldihydropteridine diphosphokinase
MVQEMNADLAAYPILVALGANLVSERWGPPVSTLDAALRCLTQAGIEILSRSRWFESAPVPISDQPWYVNGVVEVATALSAEALLEKLHEIEADFGRVRSIRNEPRVLDLDLVAYRDQVISQTNGIVVPHPRAAQRAFVLLPLKDVAPGWVHPVSGVGIDALIAALPADQTIRPVA